MTKFTASIHFSPDLPVVCCEFNALSAAQSLVLDVRTSLSTNLDMVSEWCLLSTFFRAAALLWAAGTANVAAASLRAALAAADTEEQDEKEGSDDYEQHR